MAPTATSSINSSGTSPTRATIVGEEARCAIGAVSPYVWSPSPDPQMDPEGLIWWLIVADDSQGVEGGWGTDGQGTERRGPGTDGASNQCGMTRKDLTNACGGR